MNIQNFFPYLLVALLAFTLQNCKKPEPISLFPDTPDILPPVTTEGKNTMGCYVDGKLWVAKERFRTPYSVNYNTQYGTLYLAGFRQSETGFSAIQIEMGLKNAIWDTGLYVLSFTPNPEINVLLSEGYAVFYSEDKTDDEYFVDTVHTGFLHILKLDTSKRIISGMFAFDAYNQKTNAIVKITDGRFDFWY